MEQIFTLTPRDRRSVFFFWLGVGVFPVFWAWFTMGKNFASWQRHLALGWMLVTTTAFALTWPQMAERYHSLLLGLPLLSLLVTLGLSLWLALRALSFLDWILAYIVVGGILPLQFDRLVAYAVEEDFSSQWVALPLAPALLHVLASMMQAQQQPIEDKPRGQIVL